MPNCPAGTTAQLLLTPVQVSGTYDGDTPSGQPNVYPISSFVAYPKGPSAGNPPACVSGGPTPACTGGSGNGYWRACMQVVTEQGTVTSSGWYQYQALMAATRCSITGEPAGSAWGAGSDN